MMKLLVRLFNRITIRSKMIIIMVFCLFVPIAITNAFIFYTMLNEVREEDSVEMSNVAGAVEYIIDDYVSSAYVFMDNLQSKKAVNIFANTAHASDLEYYEGYYPISKETVFTDDRFTATIYSDSQGTISGGYLQELDKASNQEWYQEFIEYDRTHVGKFLYAGFEEAIWKQTRSMALISRMNTYDDFFEDASEKLIRVDINYSKIMQALNNSNYSYTVYVCCNRYVVYSNADTGGANSPFMPMTKEIMNKAGKTLSFTEYGTKFDIYVMPGENTITRALRENVSVILIMLSLNVLIPVFATVLINRSFSERLIKLNASFEQSSENSLVTIDDIDGTDEISSLMHAYNSMAERINLLIESEYKARLQKQEVDLARQRAELTALHAQINPHFLFNALESIRMHSFVKKEDETARMVESLAVIQRQIVEWGNDQVQIEDELSFVEAYLELEKYRFGNRLMYEIAADENTRTLKVPKLSLVTFVENACVHGMENKTSACWIFVRTSIENDELVLEVEDTGGGINEELRRKLVDDIENVSLDMIRNRKSVGILNAVLRLKMSTGNRVRFEIESESGVGTMISIHIPIDNAEMTEEA